MCALCSPSSLNIANVVVPRSFEASVCGQYSTEPSPWQLKHVPPSKPLECVWQFVQLPATVNTAPPELPPGRVLEVRATDGCWAELWHCWHSSGGFFVSRAARTEPCAEWHCEQSSATGACSQSTGPRLSAWQL